MNSHKLRLIKPLGQVLNWFLSAFIIVCAYNVSAQCTNTSSYGSVTLTTTANSSGTIGCHWAGEYGTWNGIVSGNNYTSSSTVSTDFLTIRSGSASGPIVAFGTTPLTWNALTSGTHYIHVNSTSSCGTQNTCRDITTAFNAQCPAPNNLASFNISTTSFTLAFNETGSATSWQLSLDSNGTFQSYFTVTNDTITGTGFFTKYNLYLESKSYLRCRRYFGMVNNKHLQYSMQRIYCSIFREF